MKEFSESSVPSQRNGVSRGAGPRSDSSVGKQRLLVNSPCVAYGDGYMESSYEYNTVVASEGSAPGTFVAHPISTTIRFKTDLRIPKLGLMLVGWGGNNGSTVTASILANRGGLSWRTREGIQKANYYGSFTQSTTMKIGNIGSEELYAPINSVIPMVDPNDIVIGGWDISNMNLADALDRAKVLEPGLIDQVRDEMSKMVPLPSIYYPDFIAANQSERANNLIPGTKSQHLNVIMNDIKQFKTKNNLDKVIVLWTANTERYAEIIEGVNDTAQNLLYSIANDKSDEISPSTVFAVASILCGAPFINGSPQNTLVPGVIDLAMKHNVFVGGDDFKSGQTKIKSALVDFLVNAGIKPLAITSYNHLGNNDGMNLSAPKQFRSKEISKSSVVDDMVHANRILYKRNEHPDHTIVIKYVPAVGDSKRALDEYQSEIFMGGRSTISIYNVCEDSLLASPIILDLAILTELMSRITYKAEGSDAYSNFHPVLSILSYLLKAPVVSSGTPVINSLQRQRRGIENILRACVGLPPDNDMNLEFKVSEPLFKLPR